MDNFTLKVISTIVLQISQRKTTIKFLIQSSENPDNTNFFQKTLRNLKEFFQKKNNLSNRKKKTFDTLPQVEEKNWRWKKYLKKTGKNLEKKE